MPKYLFPVFFLFFCTITAFTQPNEYLGTYASKSAGHTIRVGLFNTRLRCAVDGSRAHFLAPVTTDRFAIADSTTGAALQFVRAADGSIRGLQTSADTTLWIKQTGLTDDASLITRYGNRDNGFSYSDTLRGMLTPLRSCYDVTFYHLNVRIDTGAHTVGGYVLMRYKAVTTFNRLQIDLFANMTIEKILFEEKPLTYTRAYDAVYVQFPQNVNHGDTGSITVFYHGKPQVPDSSIPMTGGIFWKHDENGLLWMETVCQGSGASLWWPNKDHLSDEPDSMHISVTLPAGLPEVSNGRLLSKQTVAGNQVQYNWAVSYPINNYNVVVNIGDYVGWTDTLQHSDGTVLPLQFYCLRQHRKNAEQLFGYVKPMLRFYEKAFGPYPFARDGFTLMESVYPMEHQGAVSVGALETKHFNPHEHIEAMWHETAHEWWGNNISVKDFADFWVHEGFADFAAVLMSAQHYSPTFTAIYYRQQKFGRKEPVTGVRDVNHFFYDLDHIYTRGNLMLNTLRHVINNDSSWFNLMRGLQTQFRYQTVTADDIIRYINNATHTDYTYFFNEYLLHTDLPELQVQVTAQPNGITLHYRWQAEEPSFHMPVQVTLAPHQYDFIYPDSSWQTRFVPGMQPDDFHVKGQERFFINARISGVAAPQPLAGDALQQYAGKYVTDKQKMFQFSTKNNRLLLESKDGGIPLSELGYRKKDVFDWDYAAIEWAFIRDANGAVTGVTAYTDTETATLKKLP
ncbi:M1 family metallopeptidase [Deminuibacter soli]|uniref:Peptidase M1 membrane alanine aminopeptidase domain-containing protein n=1 Tax=Deminuibacter soli TaxID=2291815 RepID=A0A3E1NEG1_9BACT|nr:M1 family metallopeptidase [Deminuibacter soli]RFM26373.1 hypothetical protein DXN05_20925 [Deminuibacter soli]